MDIGETYTTVFTRLLMPIRSRLIGHPRLGCEENNAVVMTCKEMKNLKSDILTFLKQNRWKTNFLVSSKTQHDSNNRPIRTQIIPKEALFNGKQMCIGFISKMFN